MTYSQPNLAFTDIVNSRGFVKALLLYLQAGYEPEDVNYQQDRYNCVTRERRDVCLAKKFTLELNARSKSGL
jgi:ferric-dicitrate binding protein FerR (iron transport regulator)